MRENVQFILILLGIFIGIIIFMFMIPVIGIAWIHWVNYLSK